MLLCSSLWLSNFLAVTTFFFSMYKYPAPPWNRYSYIFTTRKPFPAYYISNNRKRKYVHMSSLNDHVWNWKSFIKSIMAKLLLQTWYLLRTRTILVISVPWLNWLWFWLQGLTWQYSRTDLALAPSSWNVNLFSIISAKS